MMQRGIMCGWAWTGVEGAASIPQPVCLTPFSPAPDVAPSERIYDQFTNIKAYFTGSLYPTEDMVEPMKWCVGGVGG